MEVMSRDDYSDAFLRDILLTVRTIAMIGASDKETRLSYGVFGFLLARGYHVIGVNPGLAGKSVHGTAFFKTLADVPEPIDMVDIFRNSAAARGSRRRSAWARAKTEGHLDAARRPRRCGGGAGAGARGQSCR
jgi:predicted CoA-binding protein